MINRTKFLNLKKKNSNHIFNLFLFLYLIIGLFLSVNTGVSTDAFIEENIWKKNLEAIKAFFGYNSDGYTYLVLFGDKYYGVGFNFLSQIYILLVGLIVKFEGFSDEISRVLLKHSLIFFTFFLSGL